MHESTATCCNKTLELLLSNIYSMTSYSHSGTTLTDHLSWVELLLLTLKLLLVLKSS